MDTDTVILEHPRAIRATQDRHTEMLLGRTTRIGVLEQQHADLSGRVDRLDDRVARREKRLDLVEG